MCKAGQRGTTIKRNIKHKKMKTNIFLAIVFVGFAFSSCDKNNKNEILDEALQSRAKALGFEDTKTYVQFVQNNCEQGNHENCNVLANGEHRVCDNVNHKGQHHNGNHHNGSNHGSCGEKNRSCCSKNGNHNGGHNGNHH
jgi:hypothetical protein